MHDFIRCERLVADFVLDAEQRRFEFHKFSVINH